MQRPAASGLQAGTGWRNWAGAQTAPRPLAEPDTLESLREIVRAAPGPLRPVGAGHSFTPLVPTEGTVIGLDQLGTAPVFDAAAQTARVSAGSRLRALSPAFQAAGLAFKNLGDIDAQSIGGAAGTATHGTGAAFPCLAAEIQAFSLMTASGEVIEVSADEEPELWRAGQVSLGALGVMLEVTLSLRPAFRLRRRTWVAPLKTILAEAPRRWAEHRHFEFFYIPFSGYGFCVAQDETEAAPTPRPDTDEESHLKVLRRLRTWTGWSPALRRFLISRALKNVVVEDVVGDSWRLFATTRETRFVEMEYHLPEAAGIETVAAVIARLEKTRRALFWPVEVRLTAGDAAWLSPFQGGARVSMALHADPTDDWPALFGAAEPLLREAGGRPHWGKLHSLEAADLEALYPDFGRFRALRRRLDPGGRFLSPALARLFGEPIS